MNTIPPDPVYPQTEADRQWVFEMGFFIQHIGRSLQDTGDSLRSKNYVKARKQAETLKQKAEFEKTIQPDFKTSANLRKARQLFNKMLDECVNFSELLRVATVLDETESEKLFDKPEMIRKSTDRLDLLKDMLIYELSLSGWY